MPQLNLQGIGTINVPDNATQEQIDDLVGRLNVNLGKNISEIKSAESPSGIGDYALRQAGLAERAAISPATVGAGIGAGIGAMAGGVGAIPGAAVGATAGAATDVLLNLYNDYVAKTPESKVKTFSGFLDDIKGSLGLPRPVTTTEQLQAGTIEALSGLGTSLAAGKLLEQSAYPLISKVGKFLTEKPLQQVVPTIAGAVSGGFAKELGAGPAGQAAATVAGSLSPMAIEGAPRAIQAGLRGGVPREEVAKNIQTFAELGAKPTMGQATQSRGISAIENTLAQMPGSAGMMASKGIEQQKQISEKLSQITRELSPETEPSVVGAKIYKGIEENYIPAVRTRQAQLYGKLNEYIPSNQPVSSSNAYNALKELTKPIEGAPNLSANALISNRELSGLKSDLEKDMIDNNGKIPFSALKGLRTIVGEKLSTLDLVSPVSKSSWKKLYAALSSDMEDAAVKAGPDALNSLKVANKFTKDFHDRMEILQGFINKNEPEAIFKSAFSGSKEGGTRLLNLMDSLPIKDQQAVTASFASTLGKATPGMQNEIGDVFSTNRFLTNWMSLSNEAKQVLFGRYGEDYLRKMNKIAEASARIRESGKILQNYSGTTKLGVSIGTLMGLGGSILAGKYNYLAGIGAVLAAGNAGARLMTNPKFVSWLAKNYDAPINTLPAAIANLEAMTKKDNDPDLNAIINAYKASQQGK